MSDKDDDDEASSPPQQELLQTKMALRLHADNLPRHGIRMTLPDTYALVTSVSGRMSRSGPQYHANVDGNNPSSSLENSKDHVMRKTEWGRTEMWVRSDGPNPDLYEPTNETQH
jgi:hypothetical protein